MEFIRIKSFFTQGHERSVAVKKNIVFLLILKGANLCVSFFMVPLMLHYLTPSKYGIWITLSSLISWFAFFDIGLGNGLRNRYVEAKAQGDNNLIKTYVSTTYIIIGGISILLFFLFLGVNPFLKWQSILNTTEISSDDLSVLAVIVFFFFSLRFVADLISIILTADQKPAASSLIGFVANLLSFGGLSILTVVSFGNLVFAGTLLSGIPVVILILSSLILFLTSYKNIAPSFTFFKLSFARSLSSLGIQFFIIQISFIVLFTTSNIIITQLFGPESVTPYNVAQRYFGLATMTFTIILTPFWSAYTEAFNKNDTTWIKHTTVKLLYGWGVLAVGIIVMVFIAPMVYHMWVGETVLIPFHLSLAVAVISLLSMWNNIFVSFINGVGKIRLQLYSAIITGLINIPLSLFLAKKMGLGVTGVVIANCCCVAVGSVWAPIQYVKIINHTAKGIWNK